jgi:hypothetical protein
MWNGTRVGVEVGEVTFWVVGVRSGEVEAGVT